MQEISEKLFWKAENNSLVIRMWSKCDGQEGKEQSELEELAILISANKYE